MPGDAVRPLLEVVFSGGVAGTAVYQVDSRESLGSTGSLMDMRRTVVFGEIQSFLNWQVCKILVAESDDLLLGNEERELVLAGAVELAQLNSTDFGSDVGCKVFDFNSVLDEVGKGGIGIPSVIISFEFFIWRVCDIVPVCMTSLAMECNGHLGCQSYMEDNGGIWRV